MTLDVGPGFGDEILLGRRDPDSGWERLTPGRVYRYTRDTTDPTVYRFTGEATFD